MMKTKSGTASSFFGKNADALGREVRRGMIEPEHPELSTGQRCALLSIPRSSFNYIPQRETEQNFALMRLI
ncbi:MAG: hypothetical protein ACKVKF_04245 [Rhodobacterales bacterium]|nr:hypothetical protein [Puniceibacterium antarcticum]